MKKLLLPALLLSLGLSGCVSKVVPPSTQFDAVEAEYAPYYNTGTATLSGRAFLTQPGRGVIKAAGRDITLDPATSVGNEWWSNTGKVWVHRSLVPSEAFAKARRTTVADADGKFMFSDLPEGKYYIRTEVTWEIGGDYPTQGGLVGQLVTIGDGQSKDVMLNQYLDENSKE
jgi:hypothetical protein